MIVQMDTTKDGLKQRLVAAAEKWNSRKTADGAEMPESERITPHSQMAMRLAVFGFIADSLGATGADRQAAWKQFSATNAAFGTNASAMRQTLWPQASATAAKAAFEELMA